MFRTKRSLHFEPLEFRELLAVDAFTFAQAVNVATGETTGNATV